MNTSALHPAIAAALALRSRGGEGAGAAELQRFTIARTEALLRLRDVPRGGPWEWTVGLLAAAMTVARMAVAQASVHDGGEHRVIELRFSVPGARLEEVDLRGVLLASLDDAPARLGELTAGEALTRWRVLVGGAINAGLAQGPSSIEIVTPADSRVYERREGAQPGQDPYRERKGDERCPPGAFALRLREPKPSFGRRLASWLSLRAEAIDQLSSAWQRALVLANPEEDARAGIALARALPGQRVALGDLALWGRLGESREVWLVRDGVKLFALDKTLRDAGLDPAEFAGWIECPRVRLTADGQGLARDGAYELLLAWLHDARAHTFPGAGSVPEVTWPAEIAHLPTASGRPVPFAELARRAAEGRDLLFEWAHLRDLVPAQVQARVVVVWPSELAVLKDRIPGIVAVPYRSLGEGVALARADLRPVLEGSLPAIELLIPDGDQLRLTSGEHLRLRARAHIHRYPTAIQGSIILLAYERRIAQSRDERRALPGVTLVCEVAGDEAAGGLTIDNLRGDREALEAILERVRVAANAALDALWAAALAAESPWELPFVRARVAETTSVNAGLVYRVVDAELTLTWREGPWLALPIGRALGGDARTLADAFAALRDQGGVLCGDERQRWRSLEPADADTRLWILTPHGRDLCERALGKQALWMMPTAVESFLRPIDPAEQRHLLLAGEAVDKIRGRALTDAKVRAMLLAHLLVARALGAPTHDLEDAPLLRRFDPRALSASRLVSLRDVEGERQVLRLAVAEAVSRELSDVVVEATPGEARLLHRLIGLAPAAGATSSARTESVPGVRQALRRHGAEETPLVTLPVAEALAAGALRIERAMTPAKVALWAGGLHIDDLQLPAPLDVVGGRLWLTRQGVKAGSGPLAEQIRGLARELVRRALAERLLHPPESVEAQALAALVARLQGAPREGAWIADLLPPAVDGAPARAVALALSLQRQPIRRLLGGGPERLAQLLRQSLGRPVMVDSAMLSWKTARLEAAGEGEWRVELGRRSARVQRALASDAPAAATYAAAALALALVIAQARQQGLRGATRDDLVVALYRLLALVYAHGA